MRVQVIAQEYLVDDSALAERAKELNRHVEDNRPHDAGGCHGGASSAPCSTLGARRGVSAAGFAWAQAQEDSLNSPMLAELPVAAGCPALSVGFSLNDSSPKH